MKVSRKFIASLMLASTVLVGTGVSTEANAYVTTESVTSGVHAPSRWAVFDAVFTNPMRGFINWFGG